MKSSRKVHAHSTHNQKHVLLIIIVTGVDFPNRSPPETHALSQKSIVRYSPSRCPSGARFSFRGGNVDFCSSCASLNLLISLSSLSPNHITHKTGSRGHCHHRGHQKRVEHHAERAAVQSCRYVCCFAFFSLKRAGKKPVVILSLSTRETLSDKKMFLLLLARQSSNTSTRVEAPLSAARKSATT